MRCYYCNYCAETDGFDHRAPVTKERKTDRYRCQDCQESIKEYTKLYNITEDLDGTLDAYFDNVDGDELLEDSRMEDYSEDDY